MDKMLKAGNNFYALLILVVAFGYVMIWGSIKSIQFVNELDNMQGVCKASGKGIDVKDGSVVCSEAR